ncbi:MAG: hypothetical protein K2L78_02525 [Muribaculaceae bacterium]|nr:hypothetical protein [Muribaculaceae bacterium]
MRRAFLFCPENDIALGRNCSRFTPPRQAALLARYGAPLMWWLGDETDYVLVPEPSDVEYARSLASWEREMAERFGPGPRIVTSLDGLEVDNLCPWGWSGYAAQLFKAAGAETAVLQRCVPDVQALRELSHRRSATIINEALAKDVDWEGFDHPVPAGAVEARDIDAVRSFIDRHEAFYAKSPWSSSGRGVVCSRGVPALRVLERCAAVIREQGAVMMEPEYDKALDFAMLFYCDPDKRVRFHGYSRFFNARSTAYTGNLIAPDAEILGTLIRYVDEALLSAVRGALESILTRLAGNRYQGFLGVDMMVARTGGAFRLIPCVELNLRMTMGVVAHALWHRCGMRGQMCIEPGAHGELLNEDVGLVPINRNFMIKLRP